MEPLTELLGWMTVINFGLLILASITLITMRSWITGIHGRMFGLDEADLARAYMRYLSNYKIAIIVFNLVPYVSLRIMA